MKLTEDLKLKILEEQDLSPTDKGKYWIVNCPTCGKKESFLYKESDVIVCSRKNKCGDITPLENLIKESNLSVRELFNASIGDDLPLAEEIKKESLELPDGLTFFSEGDKNSFFFKQALNYVASRNISKKYIKEMGYILNPGNKFDRRLFMPFFEDGSLVFFIARDYTNKKKNKYINSFGSAEDKVFNIDKINEDECLFVFEGLFDAMTLEEQIGTAKIKSVLTEKQIIKIWDKAPRKIILVPDNDKAGFYSVKRDYDLLRRYKPPSLKSKILIYEIPDSYKDFNEFNEKKIDENKATTFNDYMIRKKLKPSI